MSLQDRLGAIEQILVTQGWYSKLPPVLSAADVAGVLASSSGPLALGGALTLSGALTVGGALTVSGASSVAALTATGTITTPSGAVGTPGLTIGTAGNGFFLGGANQINLSINATNILAWTSAGNMIWATDATLDIGAAGANRPRDIRAGRDVYTNNASFLIRASTALTANGAATSPTLGAAGPAGATTPTKWFAIDDAGTTRNIPAW